MAFCNNCGARLEPDMKFCESCGVRLGAEEPPQAAPPSPPVYQTPPPTTPLAPGAANQKQVVKEALNILTSNRYAGCVKFRKRALILTVGGLAFAMAFFWTGVGLWVGGAAYMVGAFALIFGLLRMIQFTAIKRGIAEMYRRQLLAHALQEFQAGGLKSILGTNYLYSSNYIFCSKGGYGIACQKDVLWVFKSKITTKSYGITVRTDENFVLALNNGWSINIAIPKVFRGNEMELIQDLLVSIQANNPALWLGYDMQYKVMYDKYIKEMKANRG